MTFSLDFGRGGIGIFGSRKSGSKCGESSPVDIRCAAFNGGSAIEPKRLKQLMNCSKEALRELGLTFRSYRSNGQRLVEVRYTEPVTQVPQVTQKTGP